MALLIAYQNGNFDGATTFKRAVNGTGSFLVTEAPASSQTVTTSYVYSTAFTINNAEVVEGVLLYIRRLSTTGTISIALSDDNGATATRELTVNVTDLNAEGSWHFFKFGTTLTADGGADYRIGVKTSDSSTASIFINGSNNYLRVIRSSTTVTYGADDIYIAGEITGAGASTPITITQNVANTNTISNLSIGHNGTLNTSISASTKLNVGTSLYVHAGGTYNLGTAANPVPRAYIAEIQITRSGTGLPALIVRNGGVLNAYGESRTSGNNSVWCLLNANASAGATSLTVDRDTGWLSGDEIAIAATNNSATAFELRTLSANATATTLTISAGLTALKGGVAPIQAEIINLTRNVRITARNRVEVNAGGTGNLSWIFLGSTTAGQAVPVRFFSGSLGFVEYCVFRAGTNENGLIMEADLEISSCVFYGCSINNAASNQTDDIVMINVLNGTGPRLVGNNLRVACADNTSTALLIGKDNYTCENIVVHNNNGSGMLPTGIFATFKNILVYHNNPAALGGYGGIALSISTICDFQTVEFLGNGVCSLIGNGPCEATFSNVTSAGSTTRTTTSFYVQGTSASGIKMRLDNVLFRATSGIYSRHTQNLNATGFFELNFLNLQTNGATMIPVNRQFTLFKMGSQNHNQVSGSHRSWNDYGDVIIDTTIFRTAAPSERVAPILATRKMRGTKKFVPIASGTSKTISVWVRESVPADGTDYNGNRIRLIMRSNSTIGITETIVTATNSSVGAWEQLSITTPTATADGVIEVYCDCDGTTGWINIDDWGVA